jgi:hypothetical protein
MKAAWAEDPRFETTHQQKNPLDLFRILQTVDCSYHSNQEPVLTIWNAKTDFIKLRQQKGQSVQEYFERFVALKEVNDTLGTNVHACTRLIDALARKKGQDPVQLSDNERADLISQGSERMMAIHFLLGADRERFGSAIQDFEHSYLMDHKNRYPKSLHDAYNLLKGWKKGQMSQVNKVGVSFNTNGEDEDGTALVNKGTLALRETITESASFRVGDSIGLAFLSSQVT